MEEPYALEQAAPDFAHTLLGGAGASPFGIGLRRATGRDDLSFESTTIAAEFITTGTSIEVAQRSDDGSAYPPIFVVPRYMGFPEWRDESTDSSGVETAASVSRLLEPPRGSVPGNFLDPSHRGNADTLGSESDPMAASVLRRKDLEAPREAVPQLVDDRHQMRAGRDVERLLVERRRAPQIALVEMPERICLPLTLG